MHVEQSPRRGSLILGIVAFGFFAGYGALLVLDLKKTHNQTAAVPVVMIEAKKDLEKVSNDANGWFPFMRDPVYGWEDGDEGWRLEEDDPAALAPGVERVMVFDGKTDDEESAKPRASTRKLHTSTKQKNEGNASLAVPVHFPTPATVFRPTIIKGDVPDQYKMLGVRFIAYDVFVPADCPGFVGCLFFMKDRHGLWYQARARAALLPGKWTTVTADIRGGSPDVTPLGHLGQWDDNQASRIQTIGLTFYGDKKYDGEIYVDRFRGWVRPNRFLSTSDSYASAKPEEIEVLKNKAEAFKEDSIRILNFRTEPAGAPATPNAPASPPLVKKFDTMTLRFELNRQPENPFDPEKADIICVVETPSKKTIEHIGFWYQDYDRDNRFSGDELQPIGRPEWRVRITPREVGEYKYTLRIKLKDEQLATGQRTFQSIEPDPSSKGFVSVSKKDSRFFEFENGEFYYPIGHNLHSPIDIRCWTQIFKQEPPATRGLAMYADFFNKMQKAGENTTEVWMASWWVGIEWTGQWPNYYGTGRYSLQNAWKLDTLLDMARQHEMHIHVVLDNHGKFSEWCDWEWYLNPYNQNNPDNGGFIPTAASFFTNMQARKHHKNKLRYVVARWGADPTVLGWELVSEYDLVGTSRSPRGMEPRVNFHRSATAQEWVKEMIPYLKSVDVYDHPATNHYATDYSWVDLALAQSELFDYVATDAYRPDRGYTAAAQRQQNWATNSLFPAQVKPFWITEYGGNWDAAVPAALDADVHCGMWATWMTEGGGTPLLWWYDFVDQNNLYPYYRAFANYIKGEDRRGLKGEMGSVPIGAGDTPPGSLAGNYFRWDKGAYAWVYNQSAMRLMPEPEARIPHSGVVASIPGFGAGTYKVEYWNCYDGKVVNTETVTITAKQPLPLKFPPFVNNMAVKVKAQ